MKQTSKKITRTTITMNMGIRVMKSKKDKLNSRQALNRSLKNMY